jgi:hypothetical protein
MKVVHLASGECQCMCGGRDVCVVVVVRMGPRIQNKGALPGVWIVV